MSILETHVWVNITGNMVKYYEDLNYEIPRIMNKNGKWIIERGTKIKILVYDLPPNSEVKLTKICDYCGLPSEKPQHYKDILNYRKNGDSKDCCKACRRTKSLETIDKIPIQLEKSLGFLFPEISKEWHPTLNKKTVWEVLAFSHKDAWWICNRIPEHIYIANISNRTNVTSNCPYCGGKQVDETNSLAKNNPELIDEWHPTLNGDLTPNDFTSGSNKSVWWQCRNNSDHNWYVSINNRTGVNKNGCLKCHNEFNRGELHASWKGGVTVINMYLRSQLYDWAIAAMVKYKNKCFISGDKRNLEVHHTKPFNVIRDEVLLELSFPLYKSVGEYSQEQLDILSNAIKEKHETVEGIPIVDYLHDLFHSLYGWDENVTIEDVYEFKEDYINGDFIHMIEKIKAG